jgi:tRNA nucleotidyltransferase (CCA-adding enzyme)
MPDYMYLLESRLSPEQRAVMERVQELSRTQDVNVYLTGGAVRDLISGMPIRDLDFTLEGNPVKMVRELEKGGARVIWESEKLRHHEMIFAGDVDGSVSAAREDYYERPGVKPEYRFSSVMEDLRRRDFGINAIAISLNTQSRGLLLDPMNGLADLEKQEVRALSIHAFTNQPIRLMRILRYAARMGFKMEPRTQEWFDLAIERKLTDRIEGADVGHELRALAREDNPVATLKLWESHDLLTLIHPSLQKRKPDYDSLNKLARVRSNLYGAGLRPRLHLAVAYYTLGRLKSREAASALRNLEYRAHEIEEIAELVPETQKVVKMLKSAKTNSAKDAYYYLASLPAETLAFIEVEMPNPRALSKIRNYLQKWRPLRMASPAAELDALGVERGPKFDKIVEQFFELQLRGKGKTPEDRTKILKNLAGIKDEPKKPEKKEKKRKGGKEAAAPDESKGREKSKSQPTAAKAASAASGQGKSSPVGKSATAGKSSATSANASQSAAAAIGAKAQAKHDKAEHDTKAARAATKKHTASGKKSASRSAKKSRR